ncbi:MAG: trimethylamine methyltransferase family protein [Alphaproteobacteria bacterium]
MNERPAAPRRQGGRAARRALRSSKAPAAHAAVRAGLVGGWLKPFNEDQVLRIHRAALEVLESIGVAGAIPSCIELVTAAGGRLSEKGRLCFPPGFVDDTLARACRGFMLYGHDQAHDLEIAGKRVHFGTGGAAVHVVDIDTGEYRESTLADLYDIARLVDCLDHVHWCLRPIVARDMTTTVDLDINTAYAVMSGTSKSCGISIMAPENVAPTIAMFDMVAGGEGRFRERPFCHMSSCFIVPPLTFAEESCETLEEAVRLGMPVLLICAGQAGATSPAALAGAVVQEIAEVLAGMVYVNLLAPGHPTVFGAWPFVSDLRTGAMSGGSGEQALLMAACAQMADFYGLPCSIAAGMADSKIPDAQSGFEKGYTTALAGLAGGTMVHESAGMHASLLGVSFESFVIDNDMLGAVLRTVRGIEVTDELLSIDVIAEVTAGPGHYLGHPQTLALMERDYVYPEVGDRNNPDDWKQMGATDIRTRARDRVREILSSHFPDHIDAALDARIRERFNILLPRTNMQPGNDRW